MDHKEQVRAILTGGPTLKWPLLRKRRAGFRLAYTQMLTAGEIVESGTGAMGNPVYVGLPGAEFPEQEKPSIRVRKADVRLMVLAGHTEEQARDILGKYVGDVQGYIRVLAKAEEDAIRLAYDRDAEKWQEQTAGS